MSTEKEMAIFSPSTSGWLFGTGAGWATLLLCIMFLGIPLPIIIFVWLTRKFTTYVITDQRIIIKSGVVLRKVDEIELYRVKDVRVDFSLLNQLVNIGTITIMSSDLSTQNAPLTMKNVKNARIHRESIRDLVEAIRQRRGVRELDMQNGGLHNAAEITFSY